MNTELIVVFAGALVACSDGSTGRDAAIPTDDFDRRAMLAQR